MGIDLNMFSCKKIVQYYGSLKFFVNDVYCNPEYPDNIQDDLHCVKTNLHDFFKEKCGDIYISRNTLLWSDVLDMFDKDFSEELRTSTYYQNIIPSYYAEIKGIPKRRLLSFFLFVKDYCERHNLTDDKKINDWYYNNENSFYLFCNYHEAIPFIEKLDRDDELILTAF